MKRPPFSRRVQVLLPPLRERRDDIPVLGHHFLKRFVEKNNLTPPPELTGEIIAALKAHDWPGNVRELENAIERLVVLSEDGRLSPDLLQLNRPRLTGRSGRGTGRQQTAPDGDQAGGVEEARQ